MDLKPVTWNAPDKPYHGKQAYADHIMWNDLQKWDEARKLPKSEQRKPMLICPDCGRYVVWVTSKRTGRPYLCDVVKRDHGWRGKSLYFNPSKPHFKNCAGN